MKKIIATLVIALCVVGSAMAQDELSFERKQAIDSLALEEANRVIDRAEELFMSDAEIGVSSLGSNQITYYRVRKYMEHLMRLNYDRVEIEWYNIEYVSDLQRQPDGTYVGVITIFQSFRGYDKEGNLAYKDTTKKDITVYVKRKETQIGGRTIGFWDVLLGDMRVKETTNR